MPASKTLRRLQIVTCTVCADRRQRGQPTALLVPSVGRVGDCCCCGLLPRAQMTHVHTSSKRHSFGRVIVPMSLLLQSFAAGLSRPRGALAIALSSAQRSMRRRPQSDATKPARAWRAGASAAEGAKTFERGNAGPHTEARPARGRAGRPGRTRTSPRIERNTPRRDARGASSR